MQISVLSVDCMANLIRVVKKPDALRTRIAVILAAVRGLPECTLCAVDAKLLRSRPGDRCVVWVMHRHAGSSMSAQARTGVDLQHGGLTRCKS